jgi:ABC-type dipeptide/oligopeptide/nickel transport system permease subunit
MFGRWVVIFSAVIILALVVIGIFAPLLAPHNPYTQHLRNSLQQPSKEYWLGTDEFGRDLLSRLIFGSRISILVGVVAVSIAGVFGMGLGLIASWPDVFFFMT